MKCRANLMQVSAAVSTYVVVHPNGVVTLDALQKQDLIQMGEMVCPAAKSARSNYVLITTPVSAGNVASDVLAYEPLSNHGRGANVLFKDGRCQFVPEAQFRELNIPGKNNDRLIHAGE